VKVIVTGGLGYIGSHTVVELLNAGYEVVIVDNLSNSSESVFHGIVKITDKVPQLYNVDLRSVQGLSRILEAHFDAVAVIHFAAYKSVGESMTNPAKYYLNNVYGTYNLLSTMKLVGLKNLVFSSSCTVYGEADELPVTEQTPQKIASSTYGYTKQVCERMITDFHREYDYNSVLLRYFNPIGAHQSALIGELPNGQYDNLMPLVAETAQGKRKEFTVYGTDYDTDDGTCIRDYIHVVDLAKAHVKAIDACKEKEFDAEPINLGTGEGYSVKQVLEAFERVNGVKVNTEYGDRRDGDVTAIYADPSYAKKVLGWKAELGLDEMVESTWKWQRQISKKCCGGGCCNHKNKKV
jgi:UDP-glucose 4-epimerase